MQIPEKTKETMGILKEWVSHYAPLIAMFVFFYLANERAINRVDATISNFQRSIDEVHKRCDVLHQRSDDLHREFISLLKEKKNGT